VGARGIAISATAKSRGKMEMTTYEKKGINILNLVLEYVEVLLVVLQL
jgi:hypothetical protein